jgi:hypothetical protein
VVVWAIPELQSGGAAKKRMVETRQRRQKNTNNTIQKDKKYNLKQDKDELELDLWMLQLHAEGDGNSVRTVGCDIHIVVGLYVYNCRGKGDRKIKRKRWWQFRK